MNRRLESLVSRGIYNGGLLTPQSGTLNAIRAPFLSVGWDGMTVFDLDQNIVTYTAGQTSYHVILAKYNPLGTPATPTLSEQVLSEAAYLASADINYMIVLAKVVIPGGATELLASHIDYSARDAVDPLSRSILRGAVANVAALPSQVSGTNRVGDFYLTEAEGTIYYWDGSQWQQLVAKGAATLDGAYDDNGSSPGAGRWIYADSGAVEVIQSMTTPRQRDVANAGVRIDKEDTSIDGDVGLDIMIPQGGQLTDGTAGIETPAGIIIREAIADGTRFQKDEPIVITAGTGGPITFSRVGFDMTTYLTYGGVGFVAMLVQIKGSGLGQDGVYLFQSTSSTQGTVKELGGQSKVMAGETTGITATLYIVRLAEGGVANQLVNTASKLNRKVGSLEVIGDIGAADLTFVGKTTFFLDNVSELWHFYALRDGSRAKMGGMDKLGSGVYCLEFESFSADASYSDNYAFYGISDGSVATVYGRNYGDGAAVEGHNESAVVGSSSGPGVRGSSYGEGLTRVGVHGVNSGSGMVFGVYGELNSSGSRDYGAGVYGTSDGLPAGGGDTYSAGVKGVSAAGTGVEGYSQGGSGVYGSSSTGYGGEFSNTAFTAENQITGVFPITAWETETTGSADWVTQFGNGLSYDRWRSQASGDLLLSWTDFPQGILIYGITLDYDSLGVSWDYYIRRRRWALDGSGVPTGVYTDDVWKSETGIAGSGRVTREVTRDPYGWMEPMLLQRSGEHVAGYTDEMKILIVASGAGVEFYNAFYRGMIRSISSEVGPAANHWYMW